MVFIYILQCEEDKYYVGKTDTNKFRIDTHFDSNGSEFTKKYKPIDIYQIIPECDKYDEDKYVKKYMDKYGIDNVRGGTYSRIELTTEEKKYLEKELWGANDLCFLCGGEHFVKDCPMNKTENVENELESPEIVEEDNTDKFIKYYEEKIIELELQKEQNEILSEYGSWFLTDGTWNGQQLSSLSRINISYIKKQIIKKYDEIPIINDDITNYEIYLDCDKINSHKGDILFNKCGKPREYSVLIYIKSYKNPIRYVYQFNTDKYNTKNNHLNNTNIHTISPYNSYNYYYENQKKDIESKLFLLKQQDNKQYFNVSDKLNYILNKGKNEVEENFNKMIGVIDEIINNIPEKVVAQNENFRKGCNQPRIFNENCVPPLRLDENYAKSGEFYNPTEVKAIYFKIQNEMCDIIILYKCTVSKPKDRYGVVTTLFPVYTKFNDTLNINLRNTQIYIQKFNEYGFNTYFQGMQHFDTLRFNNTSFYIYF